MDRLLEQLGLLLEKEDKAAHELYAARNEMRSAVRENLPALVETGVVKISIDRFHLRRMRQMGHGGAIAKR